MDPHTNTFKSANRSLRVENHNHRHHPHLLLHPHPHPRPSFHHHLPLPSSQDHHHQQHSFIQEQPPPPSHHHHHHQHHHRRDPSHGNENRRKTIGGVHNTHRRKEAVGEAANPLTHASIREGALNAGGVDVTKYRPKLDEMLDNIVSHPYNSFHLNYNNASFVGNQVDRSRHNISSHNDRNTVGRDGNREDGGFQGLKGHSLNSHRAPINEANNKKSGTHDKNLEHFQQDHNNQIQGAFFGYNNTKANNVNPTTSINTNSANHYEYLQSRKDASNIAPNTQSSSKTVRIMPEGHIANNISPLKIATGALQSTHLKGYSFDNKQDTQTVLPNSSSLLITHSPMLAPTFNPALPSPSIHNQQLQTHQLQYSHSQLSQLPAHPQKHFIHNIPVSTQLPEDQINITVDKSLETFHEKPNIQPPSYEDIVEKDGATFRPFPMQSSRTEGAPPHHSRAKSDVQRGRARLASDPSNSGNKWNNLTVASPKMTLEPVALVPIGVQSIETYLPRLTLQDNNTTLQRVRSRSLARNTTMERNRNQEVERVEREELDSPGWYVPAMTRSQAISYLRNKPSGSFLVRKSSSYSGLYTLVVMVEREDQDGVRDRKVCNFLIEVSPTGARLKGYKNEPEFVNLQALIDHHCEEALGLPCKLLSPARSTRRESSFRDSPPTMHFGSFPTDGFPDYVALKNSFKLCSVNKDKVGVSEIDVEVTREGITLEKMGQRQFFPMKTVSHCAVDSHNKSWNSTDIYENIKYILFGFVVQTSNTTKQEVQVFSSVPEKANLFVQLTKQFMNC